MCVHVPSPVAGWCLWCCARAERAVYVRGRAEMLARAARLTALGGAGCIAASYADQYRQLTTVPFQPGSPASEAPQTGRTLSERCLESCVMSVLGLYSKFAMQVCNTTHFDNDQLLRRLIAEGGPGRQGRGLVTVSNHVTAVDDPGVVATLIDAKDFYRPVVTPFELSLALSDGEWTGEYERVTCNL